MKSANPLWLADIWAWWGWCTEQRASTLASCRPCCPWEKRMWIGLWAGGKQLCICLPALWALPGRGTGIASARPTKEHCLCDGKGDVLAVCRSECGFPCGPLRAALAAACTHSLPGRFGSHCQTTFWMTGLDGAKVSSHEQGGACKEMSQKQEGFRHNQELFRLENRLGNFWKSLIFWDS